MDRADRIETTRFPRPAVNGNLPPPYPAAANTAISFEDRHPARVRAGIFAGAIVMASLCSLAWGGPIVARMITVVDFPDHIAGAEAFAADGSLASPHFLLHVLLGAILALAVAPSLQVAVVFFSVLYMAAGAAVCWYVGRDCLVERSARRCLLCIPLAIAVLMSGPIVPQSDMDLYLIGYFPPNVYHNPTMLLAKPLLVLVLASAVASATRTNHPSRGELIALTSPVVLLGLAKPNYLGCLVVVLAGAHLWRRIRSRRNERNAGLSSVRIAAVICAALSTLALTYGRYRAEERFETGISFAPLDIIGEYADTDAITIAASLVGSMAFPLAVSLLWPSAVRRDPAMRIAWGGAVVGILISYLLAENGPRRFDGNFLWTGQMAVFVLFVAAASFVQTQFKTVPRGAGAWPRCHPVLTTVRAMVVLTVLLLHVEAGVRHARVMVAAGDWLAFWR